MKSLKVIAVVSGFILVLLGALFNNRTQLTEVKSRHYNCAQWDLWERAALTLENDGWILTKTAEKSNFFGTEENPAIYGHLEAKRFSRNFIFGDYITSEDIIHIEIGKRTKDINFSEIKIRVTCHWVLPDTIQEEFFRQLDKRQDLFLSQFDKRERDSVLQLLAGTEQE